MHIIDMHTHVFPDDLAEKTISFLAREAKTEAYLNGTISDLKKSMKRAGISLSVNQPIATKPSQVPSINNWAISINDSDILSFGTIHPLFEDFEDEIQRIRRLGVKGVKLHPDYQDFYIDDESVFPLYAYLEHNDMIILFHAGVDIGLYPPVHATPERLARVLDLFPKLKIIAAHLGGYDCWDEVEKNLVGKELFFDTSYVIDYLVQGRLIKIMKEHGFDKILFATDSPWKPQDQEVKNISALPISDKYKESIFYTNAYALLSK